MTNTKKAGVFGTAVLVVLVAVLLIVCRHKIAHPIALAGGKRAIATHRAALVDLTANYRKPASFFPKITAFPGWKTVPIGFQVFDHVPFQIDGYMCLWGDANAKAGLVFPEQILGIPMNREFETLYVYHAAFYDSPSGTPVCEVVFRYEDGSSVTNRLLYGSDMLNWIGSSGPTGPDSKLAWTGGTFTPGRNQPLRFCLTAIDNPYPSLEVYTIDLYSCKNRPAACILAMTAGKSGLMK